jgi:serine/threonine protein kinase
MISHNFRFIVNMNYAFQDNDNLYLVMDLLTGGDLRYHICKHKKFSEEQTSNLLLLYI